MQFEYQGMRLWVEPDERTAKGIVEPYTNVELKVGVEPPDASNHVQIRYRVNGGPLTVLGAEPVKQIGNTQHFTAQLHAELWRPGDTVEYSALCRCAARQVPSPRDQERFGAFRVLGAREGVEPGPLALGRPRAPEASQLTVSSESSFERARVSAVKRALPGHLSVFAMARDTGRAMAGVPFYAEVGVTSSVPPEKPVCRLKEAIAYALREFEAPQTKVATYTRVPAEKLASLLCEALSRLLATASIEQLASDPRVGGIAVASILRIARDLAQGKTSVTDDPGATIRLLDQAIRDYAKQQGLELANLDAELQRIVWAHPLGVLATDHLGYLSFDLTHLPVDVSEAVLLALETRRRNPTAATDTSLWLYPLALQGTRVDALAQLRFADDAIVVRLELDQELGFDACGSESCDARQNFGHLSMQNPSLTDWRLSPGSFATNPGGLVGADGCEMVLPSNAALHEFNFHQVVGIPASEIGLTIDSAAKARVRPGFVNEYRLSFVPIGHSLGQVLYTFPLAPGESVNFAVIDWTRRDSALRTEATKLDESLVHELRRDRLITETVRASIDEWQRGGSIMGGQATSVGGAMGGSGMGVAAGASNAIGGAYSTTSGTRDIAANTVQKLSDNVAQAASSSRELHSTVVVQSSQAEHEAIETRTVVNYNHSHTLTILYYEVLRHFRVVTEFVRRRPALLTNIHGGIAYVTGDGHLDVWWPAVHENRKVLEAALLDERYKEAFVLLEQRLHRQQVEKIVGPPPTPTNRPAPVSGPYFRHFAFELRTGNIVAESSANEDVQVCVNILLNEAPWWVALNSGKRISPPGAFFIANSTYWFSGQPEPKMHPSEAIQPDFMRTIPWGKIEGIDIGVFLVGADDASDSDISFSFIKVTGIDVDGKETVLFEKDYKDGHVIIDNDWFLTLPARRPAPLPPPPPARSVESIEEEAKIHEFAEHLLYQRAHYERALRLGATPAQRAFELANLRVSGEASLLEKVDNRPLEVLGDFVAYPCIDPEWTGAITQAMDRTVAELALPDIRPVERLITLPSRGVFAEAKLGHCNASEKKDPTRFWNWQESPIPHFAPEIAATQPVTPQAMAPAGLQPTAFPQSLVNIVNPPSAPDPQGMTAALTALATANIFRDMSGRAEVADLLKKLSDNSVAIAGVAQKAATGGATPSGSSGGSGGGASTPLAPQTGGGTAGSIAPAPAPSPPPNQSAAPPQQTSEQVTSQQLDNQNKKLQIAKEQLTPAQQDAVRKKVTQDLVQKSPEPLGFLITFQSALYGQPIQGRARIEVAPFGQRVAGSEYEQGTTIGPPSDAQTTTIPEVFDVKVTNGNAKIQTSHASAPGTISITLSFAASPDVYVQVVNNSSAYDPATSLFTLTHTRPYEQPNSGNVVILNVQPKVIPKKLVAKDAKSVVNELGTEAGGTLEVVTAKATAKSGTTISGESGQEFEVNLMTGALLIEQTNARKPS